MSAGFLSSRSMIICWYAATSPTLLPANTSGWAWASSTDSGSSGHPGVTAT